VIAIVNTGCANIASVRNACERLGMIPVVTTNPETILKMDHVILPGVGAAGAAMDRIRDRELFDCLRQVTKPMLGICLGMQLLFEKSTEGDVSCLGLIPGHVAKLVPKENLPVPHMGWNRLEFGSDRSLLGKGVAEGSFVYFVHSFVAPQGPHTRATFQYSGRFPAIVEFDNHFGVQFHPERSGEVGARILRNFLEL
jgi:imidazole glycerol-phosphate synthase subunit HisH